MPSLLFSNQTNTTLAPTYAAPSNNGAPAYNTAYAVYMVFFWYCAYVIAFGLFVWGELAPIFYPLHCRDEKDQGPHCTPTQGILTTIGWAGGNVGAAFGSIAIYNALPVPTNQAEVDIRGSIMGLVVMATFGAGPLIGSAIGFWIGECCAACPNAEDIQEAREADIQRRKEKLETLRLANQAHRELIAAERREIRESERLASLRARGNVTQFSSNQGRLDLFRDHGNVTEFSSNQSRLALV